MFELPIAGILQPIPDPNSPTIQHVCQTYNISVSFKQRSRMYGATVIVRGSQNNTSAVKVISALNKVSECHIFIIYMFKMEYPASSVRVIV